MRAQLIRIASGLSVVLASAFVAVAPGPAAVSAAPSVAAAAQPRSAASPFTLFAFKSRLVMTTSGKLRPGAPVLTRIDRDKPGQRWLFDADGTVRPSANQRLCLTAPRSPSSQLRVWTCGGASQHFVRRLPSAQSPVMFISPAGHRKQCLTVAGLSQSSPVNVAACGDSDREAWATTYLGAPASPFASMGTLGPNFTSVLAVSQPLKAGQWPGFPRAKRQAEPVLDPGPGQSGQGARQDHAESGRRPFAVPDPGRA